MVFTGEFLSLLLLVTSAAALGISLVIDVGRLSAEKARSTVLQRLIDKKRMALAEWRSKGEKKSVELKAQQARLTEFISRKQKIQNEIKAIEFTKIELAHEIGESDEGAIGFWSLLVVMPNFNQVDRRDILFSRQIWDYRNVAHVWANSSEQAQALLRTAFHQRAGVQPTQMLPLAFAPDPAEAMGGQP